MASRFMPDVRQVYFIEAAILGLVKIGISDNPRKRLQTMQTGSPDRLFIRGVWHVDDAEYFERRFHRRFRRCHVRGEWFMPDKRMKAFMDELLWDADDPPRVIFCKRRRPAGEVASYRPAPGEPQEAFATRMFGDMQARGIDTGTQMFVCLK